MKAILTLLLLLTCTLCLPIDDSATQGNATLSKRWFSVPPSPANPESAPQVSYPWPQDRSGRRPIRYCFKDEKSYEALGALFMGPAIKMWERALWPRSALRIVPDPRCVEVKGRPPTRFADDVAGQGDVFDALVISDITPPKSGDSSESSSDYADSDDSRTVSKLPTPGSGSLTTVGYDLCRGDETERFPNSMKILNSAWEYPYEKALLIRSMAHELGHAIGIEHEHQRPDRDQFIRVDFSKLSDWGKAYQNVMRVTVQQQPRFMNLSPAQRMALVTSDEEMAKEYGFEQAKAWIKAPRTGNSELTLYQRGQQFDYDSIMMYGSFTGTAPDIDQHDMRNAVMTTRDRTGPASELFQGGNEDARRAGASQLDVSRVRQIYPSTPGRASGSGSRGCSSG